MGWAWRQLAKMGALAGPQGGRDLYPGITAYDTFTDTNGVLLPAHDPDKAPSGATWAVARGTIGIQSNAAQPSAVVSNLAVALLDVGLADCTLVGVFNTSVIGSYLGFMVRATDADNGIAIAVTNGSLGVYKRDGGAVTPLQTKAWTQFASVSVALVVTLSGATITAQVEATPATLISISNSFHQTTTQHGLYFQNVADQCELWQVVP